MIHGRRSWDLWSERIFPLIVRRNIWGRSEVHRPRAWSFNTQNKRGLLEIRVWLNLRSVHSLCNNVIVVSANPSGSGQLFLTFCHFWHFQTPHHTVNASICATRFCFLVSSHTSFAMRPFTHSSVKSLIFKSPDKPVRIEVFSHASKRSHSRSEFRSIVWSTSERCIARPLEFSTAACTTVYVCICVVKLPVQPHLTIQSTHLFLKSRTFLHHRL